MNYFGNSNDKQPLFIAGLRGFSLFFTAHQNRFSLRPQRYEKYVLTFMSLKCEIGNVFVRFVSFAGYEKTYSICCNAYRFYLFYRDHLYDVNTRRIEYYGFYNIYAGRLFRSAGPVFNGEEKTVAGNVTD